MDKKHKDKIAKSRIGKTHTDKVKQQISESVKNSLHSKRLLWTVQDPRGHIYITPHIKDLCKKFNIPYSTLRLRHQQRNTTPIWSGAAKGWAVLRTEILSKLSE